MTLTQSEHHVFLLWHNGLSFAGKLLEKIQRNLLITHAGYLQWTPERFRQNLVRFYGPEASLVDQKAAAVGTGPFLAILVKDKNPVYALRQTTDGPRHVNTNIFDIKSEFRSLLPNKWLLHSSVTAEEGIKDCVLLYGQAPRALKLEDFNVGTLQTNHRDLPGSEGFADLADMFGFLNEVQDYVLLFEDAATLRLEDIKSKEGQVLTLLTLDHALTSSLLNAQPLDANAQPKGFLVRIAGRNVRVVIRDTFDGFFCPVWSRDILKRKRKSADIYVPAEDDAFYTALYEICVRGTAAGPLYEAVVEEAAARGLAISSAQEVAYHCRKYIVRRAYSAPRALDPGLPDRANVRRALVRKAYIPPTEAPTRPRVCANVAELRKVIPGSMDNILAQLASIQPLMHKRTEGWYESKVWRCIIPMEPAPADLCMKVETFVSEEMKLHAQTKAPLAMARLTGDFVPRLYGYQIKDNSLIICTEWIEGERLHNNVPAIVADLVTSGEIDAFIDAMYGYLDFLKRTGIEHRDIWEKNVIVRNRRPVFIDFTWSCLAGEGDYYPPLALCRDDQTSMERLIALIKETARGLVPA